MSPIRQQPYLANNYKGFKKNDKDASESSSSAATQHQEENHVVQNNGERKTIQQKFAESKAAHQSAIQSRDANLKNATINIAQIIKDFKNTSHAIGSPQELMDEVNTYLSLVEKQVVRENPDAKLIRSNLKNAASLLDNYITETLQRKSNVVENWLDALFLQQINYKFNDEEVNPHFLVKFPNEQEKNKQQNSDSDSKDEQEQSDKEDKNNDISIPQDEKLKTLFISAKKYSYANDNKNAMKFFKEALTRSIEVQDKETESKILFEIGQIYDKNDYLEQALSSYSKSLQTATDTNVKTKAHFSMAKIYDDVAQFEPAINHYMSSISYAGVSENLIAQSTSLTKIGSIYTDKYKAEALDFLHEAELLANETKSSKTKGYVSSNIANAYNKFNKPKDAMKYYLSAIKEYNEAGSILKTAINYKRAAELMLDYKNYKKAKSLFQKALNQAKRTEDKKLMDEISIALSAI